MGLGATVSVGLLPRIPGKSIPIAASPKRGPPSRIRRLKVEQPCLGDNGTLFVWSASQASITIVAPLVALVSNTHGPLSEPETHIQEARSRATSFSWSPQKWYPENSESPQAHSDCYGRFDRRHQHTATHLGLRGCHVSKLHCYPLQAGTRFKTIVAKGYIPFVTVVLS